MKKKYLFMSSFFIIGTIFTLLYFFSYRSYDAEQKEAQAQNANTVDTVREIRTNTSMKYVIESYDGTTNVVTAEETTVPVEMAGKTREELEQYISEYNAMSAEDKLAEEPTTMELISFSKEKIVVRATYAGAEEEKGFYLKLENKEVVIFHNDMVTPYEYTGITEDILPKEEKEKLQAGYFVADEKELYSVLENLSS